MLGFSALTHNLLFPVRTAPLAECRAVVDLIFVLDASGSIGEAGYSQMKSFVSQLINKMDMESGNVRVGLLSFSSSVYVTVNLNAHTSRAAVRAALDNMRYSGERTNTSDALAHVRRVMLQQDAGDRANVPNVVVVLTDGGSNNKRATLVSFLTAVIHAHTL